ncbi:hypothetical protein H9655_10970 [Cytobacillus sp. Sa5YUA1]|uniref:Uncharacterized protein n=1 Tax=Cytobacillus stercorigallinarum TaxID=2762240 RepID=A0ABR8QPT0_9BACI|nr:hypothetical protein [Cytobacillus stercorigallinarum]MBD7937545.1 hypothetical protein [Cytobacillus stercorigallinarum]
MIITLCGSTKFKQQFIHTEGALTYNGHIVLSLGFFEHSDRIYLSDEKLNMLQELHLRKIDLSDAIYVIDEGAYIGESTRKEIQYAKSKGKDIYYYSSTKNKLDMPLQKGCESHC